jgi:hypothetical protein
MHGIILIGKNENNTGDGDNRRDAMHCVSTTDDTNDTDAAYESKKSVNQFGPQSKNLGSILRGYKSAVTSFARKHNIQFNWQARFHDHIIRSMDEYYRISNYITNNPLNWQQDKFYK